MKKYKINGAVRQALESLEDRQLMSSVLLNNTALEMHGNAKQDNTFIVRAAGNNRVLAIADDNGRAASLSKVDHIVVYAGDKANKITVNRDVKLPVDVIFPDGEKTTLMPGTTKTFAAGEHTRTHTKTPDGAKTGSSDTGKTTTTTGSTSTGSTTTTGTGTTTTSTGTGTGSKTGTGSTTGTTTTSTGSTGTTTTGSTGTGTTTTGSTGTGTTTGTKTTGTGTTTTGTTSAGSTTGTGSTTTTGSTGTGSTTTTGSTGTGSTTTTGSTGTGSTTTTGSTGTGSTTTTGSTGTGSTTTTGSTGTGSTTTTGSTGTGSTGTGSINNGTTTGTTTTGTGSTSGTSTGGTTTTSGATAPTPVLTFTGNTTVYPNETINAKAILSSFGDGTVTSDTIAWNFGDGTGAHNSDLVGFNAAHIYSAPGTYTVTLTITTPGGAKGTATGKITVMQDNRTTIYVAANGSDSNNGLSASSPIQSISKVNSLLGNNVRILFKSGDTFQTTSGINLGNDQHVYIGSYGTGAQPIIKWNGPKTYGALIGSLNGMSGLTVQGLTFDSIYVHDGDADELPDGFKVGGSNIAIVGNTFYNVLYAMDLSAAPSNVYIADNSSPDPAALNAYFVWTQGNDIVIAGNTVANSMGESLIRVGGAADLLIANNHLSNIGGVDGVAGDEVKGAIAVQAGSYAYIYNNVIPSGDVGVGPLGVNESTMNNPLNIFNYAVFDSNTIGADSRLGIQPNSHHLNVRNNVFLNSSITIDATQPPNWVVTDLTIQHNTVVGAGEWQQFLGLNNGEAQGIVMDYNLFVNPTFETGSGQGIVKIGDNDLNSFTEIKDNVWAIPSAIGSWAQGGYFYVSSIGGDQNGYKTPAEWEAMTLANGSHPTGDVYQNVTLGSTYSVNESGFTAGSTLTKAA